MAERPDPLLSFARMPRSLSERSGDPVCGATVDGKEGQWLWRVPPSLSGCPAVSLGEASLRDWGSEYCAEGMGDKLSGGISQVFY
jgi:hypothetical protein